MTFVIGGREGGVDCGFVAEEKWIRWYYELGVIGEGGLPGCQINLSPE